MKDGTNDVTHTYACQHAVAATASHQLRSGTPGRRLPAHGLARAAQSARRFSRDPGAGHGRGARTVLHSERIGSGSLNQSNAARGGGGRGADQPVLPATGGAAAPRAGGTWTADGSRDPYGTGTGRGGGTRRRLV